MTLKLAIVGSGPAGFYTADALLKADSACRIDIIDRLPTPYGLIRFGVAPDHEKTKNVMRGFARTASDERVNFYGDVDIGEALSLDELRGMYDAVVLAVGRRPRPQAGPPRRGQDRRRRLGELRQLVHNAHARFRGQHARSRHLERGDHRRRQRRHRRGARAGQDAGGNGGDPTCRTTQPGPSTARRSATSTWWRAAARSRPSSPTSSCARWVISSSACPRSPPPTCLTRLPARCPRATCACARRTSGRCAPSPSARPTRSRSALHFVFFASPVEILGDGRAEAVRFERTRVENGRAVGTGEHFEIACGLVVAAVGLPLPARRRRALRPQERRRRERGGPRRTRPLRGGLDQAGADRRHRNQQGRRQGLRPADPRRPRRGRRRQTGPREALEALLRARAGAAGSISTTGGGSRRRRSSPRPRARPRRKLYRREDFYAVLDEHRAAG